MLVSSRIVVLVGVVVCLSLPRDRSAHAGTDSVVRCRRLAAEADSTAALLFAPSLSVQGFHVPSDDPDVTLADGYRARALVTFSAIDLLRGRRVLAAARAECAAATSAEDVERALAQGAQYGRAGALRAQVAVLDAGAARIDELLADAAARRERQIITLIEQNELTMRALRLRRQAAEARDELALLADDTELPATAWRDVARHDERALAAERERSRLRRLAAWQLDVQAGAGPAEDGSVDWYGLVTFSMDLGVIGQARAERRYLRARADELAGDDAGLHERLDRFTRAMTASAAELATEVELVRTQLDAISTERTQLAKRSVDAWKQLDASLELDALELEARRAYLEHLIATRRAVHGTDQ